MNLRSIILRDWKAYRQARFDFPAPDGDRNIILIGAPNGYGKTSLFEALTLGLYGREGLPLVPRATLPAEGEAEAKLNISYSKFLSESLHKRALDQGRSSCTVELQFDDDDDEPVVLERRWHFSGNGQHKLYDDELLIFEGLLRIPVGPPGSNTDKSAWQRDFIAQTFLPPHLAAFFLFDGEQVQRFARRDMAGQVRRGIEGLLGLPVLRALQDSLRRYAVDRRSRVAAPTDELVKTVQADIAKLEAEIAEARRKISESEALIPRLEQERDELSGALASFGGGSVALVAELLKDEERLRSAAERALEQLMVALSGDVALALSGSRLRQQTVERLTQESIREAWENGRAQGDSGLERFIERLGRQISLVTPALDSDQIQAVLQEAREAWEALWFPPPENCAPDYMHSAITGPSRVQVINRLEIAGQRSSVELRELLRSMRESTEGAEAKRRGRLAVELNAPEADEKRKRLEEVSEQLGREKNTRDTLERSLLAAEGQLAARRQELGRHTDAIGRGERPLRLAERAETIADLITDILTEAVPAQVNEVAGAMTEAWAAMTHKKGIVDRIEITPDCEVKLLNRRGEDLRQLSLSAGEEQVFTQALIRAVARVSGRAFPFVVDTPLARLDEQHRIGVLRHFTDHSGQVILLSTDTEVVGPYLDAIRRRVLAAYKLSVRTEEGITVTSIEQGYFERV
jgi:DNA sulfur modification protein DndD